MDNKKDNKKEYKTESINLKTSKLSGSIVEIEGELPVAAVEKRRAAAIKMLGKNIIKVCT